MRTFPAFIDVTGQPPLIFGGGDMAAIKARLIAKRAPQIEIATPEPGDAVSRLADDGVVAIVDAEPTISTLRGRPFVIAATDDDNLNAEISAIAKSLGVPVNVPDRPTLCSFFLPAIVDRSEVTIAISTDGHAPVLAQRLRAWLENELNPKLGELARIAGQFRDRVARTVPDAASRRRLWETVFNGNVAGAVYAGHESIARKLISNAIDGATSAALPPARVILVGAGPGDP
ncbi:MAG: precorrin-2 dehydrogenase/sirohydrochlorin ferrochelatase family protein, partial [Hyphomicrobiaceae bacterium]